MASPFLYGFHGKEALLGTRRVLSPTAIGSTIPEGAQTHVSIVVDSYGEERREPSGAYVVTHGVRDHLVVPLEHLEDILSRLFPYFTSAEATEAIGPYALVEAKRPPVEGHALECGEMRLPLKGPLRITARGTDRLVLEDFNIELPIGSSNQHIAKAAIHAYLVLESKAARGLLTNEEMARWKRICNVVNREAAFRLRSASKPKRILGEVIKEETGRRAVRLVSGLELPLTDSALATMDFLDPGEWFEADVFQDSEGAIVGLKNIDLRPDYHIATAQEIERFFAGKPTD
jgi:hypothetical protein